MRHSLKDQLKVEVNSFLKGYPDFVLSKTNSLKGNYVFVYHTIDLDLFESHLKYLKENNYKTLSIHEFYEILTGKKSYINNKHVLLTIDDARLSVWKYAFPLLKKYQLKATVFVIPGLTNDENNSRKNLSDYWDKKCTFDEVKDFDPNDNLLCNWNEISEMYKSGLVSIESHTLFHRENFRNNNIQNFYEKNEKAIGYSFQAAPYLKVNNSITKINSEDFLGLPLFEASPLMSVGPKLLISEEFIKLSKEIYKNKSGEKWKDEIRRLSETKKGKYFEIIQDSSQDVIDDLHAAREIIQNKLGLDAGNHFCLPWTIGNEKTIKILKELNIKSCFWGVLPKHKNNLPGDPYHISRIKNDFVYTLPGNGRKSFISIYSYKFKRRLAKAKVY